MSNIPYPQPMMQESDPINALPVDTNPPSPNDIHLVNTFFSPENKFSVDAIVKESKDSIIILILYIILSLNKIDEILSTIIPIVKNSPYLNTLIKGLLMGILFWIIKFYYLSRQDTY
jgi:hypothetical protein